MAESLEDLLKRLEEYRRLATALDEDGPSPSDLTPEQIAAMSGAQGGGVSPGGRPGITTLRGGQYGSMGGSSGGGGLTLEALMEMAGQRDSVQTIDVAPSYRRRMSPVSVQVGTLPGPSIGDGMDRGPYIQQQMAAQMAYSMFANQQDQMRQAIAQADEQIGQYDQLAARGLKPEGQRLWNDIAGYRRAIDKMKANPRITPQQIHEKQQDLLRRLQESKIEMFAVPDPTAADDYQKHTFIDPDTGARIQRTMRNGVPSFSPVYSSTGGSGGGYDPAEYLKNFKAAAEAIQAQRERNAGEEDFVTPATEFEVQQWMEEQGFAMPPTYQQKKAQEAARIEAEAVARESALYRNVSPEEAQAFLAQHGQPPAGSPPNVPQAPPAPAPPPAPAQGPPPASVVGPPQEQPPALQGAAAGPSAPAGRQGPQLPPEAQAALAELERLATAANKADFDVINALGPEMDKKFAQLEETLRQAGIDPEAAYEEIAGRLPKPKPKASAPKRQQSRLEQLMNYLPQPKSKDEFDQLPPGTIFKAPDGSFRRK